MPATLTDTPACSSDFVPPLWTFDYKTYAGFTGTTRVRAYDAAEAMTAFGATLHPHTLVIECSFRLEDES